MPQRSLELIKSSYIRLPSAGITDGNHQVGSSDFFVLLLLLRIQARVGKMETLPSFLILEEMVVRYFVLDEPLCHHQILIKPNKAELKDAHV